MAITHTMTNSVKTMKDSNNTKTNQKSKIRMSAGDRAVEVICYIIFAIAAFLCLYPFYYIVINTISANDISARGDILFVPQQIHFHNYISAFRIEGLPQAFKISLMRTVLGKALQFSHQHSLASCSLRKRCG